MIDLACAIELLIAGSRSLTAAALPALAVAASASTQDY